MVTALVGGTLIDGNGGAARPDTTVVVDGGAIREVSQQRDFGSEVRVIDLEGRHVMPGLIDCHAHFANWGTNLAARGDANIGLLAAETVAALRTTLEVGCTTARDLGGLDVGFREGVNRGLISGPRLQCSIVIISPTNGILDPSDAHGTPSTLVPGIPSPTCNGPYEARAKVREVLRHGADVIKIASTGGVSSPKVDPRRQVFTREEIEAIVDEAHMAGVPVTCHALGGPGLLMAVQAGVDCIEHGSWLTEEVVAEMVRRGTWWVPTFAVYRWHGTIGPEFKQIRARGMREDHLKSFALAREAGVKIAMGTDIGGYGYGDTALELELLVEAGMTSAEAITTSTRRSSECLGLYREIGTLEAGKRADLIVIDGDPLADITILRRKELLALVMKDGVGYAGGLRHALE